ncbi:UB2J1 enzyme, partial [Nothocercus nigrocapillus]|nr:UB2J1 enzyme [Nothocercus nigrocapillus]
LLLKANGRFEVGKKICLSISGHHPETWQPSWSIRTALLAIIGFMPTKGEGAIGSLDYTPEERRALAKKEIQNTVCVMVQNTSSLRSGKHFFPLYHGCSPKAIPEAVCVCRGSGDCCVLSSAACSAPSVASIGSLCLAADTTGVVCKIFIIKRSQNPPSIGARPGQEQAPPAASSNTSLSPRQRRAQQQSQRRAPSSTDFNRVQQPRVDMNHTGSTVLIVLLTLALTALIFRRIYLANEYKFE